MTTTIWDVIEHHNGWVVRVTTALGQEYTHTTLHLAFRNAAGKQLFSYAMRQAWSPITVINHPGTANLDIVVPLGIALVQAL